MQLLKSKDYHYMIKMKGILDAINSNFWNLIDSPMREINKPNIILGHLLLEVVGKKLISKEVLLIVGVHLKSKI